MARAGLTPDLVVRAGADLADEVGFDEVTVSALARRLGVRVASLYSHVGGSDDLRTRIALLALDELADLASEALAGRAGTEALVAFAGAYRDFARQHPGRYAAMQIRLSPEAAASGPGGRHADLTRAILRGYGLTGVDETHAVRLIGSVVHGFTTLELGGGFDHSAPPPDRTWSRILEGVDTVLRSWATPS
jgi:AcrR family transcriptional regulator